MLADLLQLPVRKLLRRSGAHPHGAHRNVGAEPDSGLVHRVGAPLRTAPAPPRRRRRRRILSRVIRGPEINAGGLEQACLRQRKTADPLLGPAAEHVPLEPAELQPEIRDLTVCGRQRRFRLGQGGEGILQRRWSRIGLCGGGLHGFGTVSGMLSPMPGRLQDCAAYCKIIVCFY